MREGMAQKISLKVMSWTVGWGPMMNSVLDLWGLSSYWRCPAELDIMRIELKRKIWTGNTDEEVATLQKLFKTVRLF